MGDQIQLLDGIPRDIVFLVNLSWLEWVAYDANMAVAVYLFLGFLRSNAWAVACSCSML